MSKAGIKRASQAMAELQNARNDLLEMFSSREKPVAGIIFNGTENGKTIWIADFSRNGLTNTGDDHKHLLTSLVFSVANKYTKETFQQASLPRFYSRIAPYVNFNTESKLLF